MSKRRPERIQRAKTAIRRVDYSRPVRIALAEGILTKERTFLDYGCGQGDDHRRLSEEGYDSGGWDPSHSADSTLRSADVVNLGYVVNVIEDPTERTAVLRRAWDLSRRVLVVAARMTFDRTKYVSTKNYGDGCVTTWRTFQKFFGQNELREWISSELGSQAPRRDRSRRPG